MRPALLLALLAAACGGGDPALPDARIPVDGGPPATRYLPLVVGATWTYDVSDPTRPTAPHVTKVQTVEALEDVGGPKAGVIAYRLRTTKSALTDTVSWQQDFCDAVVRHREQTFTSGSVTNEEVYDPYKLRIDDRRVAPGTSFTETYTDTDSDATGTHVAQRTDAWTVVGVEDVTVPAGTFSALHLHRETTTATGGSTKDYWFVKGVGKVKETGGQTEELMSYTIP